MREFPVRFPCEFAEVFFLPVDELVELLVLLRRGPVIPPDGVVEELALPLDELVLSPVLLGDEHVFECTRASPLEQRASKQMK